MENETYTVSLEGMEFRAAHGCFELEKVVGNRFEVDLQIDLHAGDAARGDEMSRTVNYAQVYELVGREMAHASNILENVALRIVDALYDAFPQVCRVRVRVAKIAPPLGGKVARAAVSLER